MRKQKSYLMAVAASLLMLPGCTSDDLSENFVPFLPGDSEVPISLSSGVTGGVSVIKDKPSTRAAIEDINEITNLYVYCLATAKQAGEGIPDIDWTATSGLSCLMRNVQATCADGSVTWDGVYYYPLTQYYCYSFFAFTPVSKENPPKIYDAAEVPSTDAYGDGLTSAGGKMLLVTYTIDGTNDLIWGTAAGNSTNMYSANYFRKEADPQLPTLQLKHLLTRLKFTVTATQELKDKADQEIEIVGITVKQAIQNVGLCVAHNGFTDASKEGSLFPRKNSDGSEQYLKTDFKLKDNAGTEISSTNAVQVQKATDNTAVGESMMLYPESTYTITVSLRAQGTDDVVTTDPITLTVDGGFQAGSWYSVNLNISSLEEVQLKAQLDKWASGGSVVTPEEI